nr:immunoglobulin heavy chain junction region [Macaca mulatta]
CAKLGSSSWAFDFW